jgi:ADP-heptose:LPS heptosyltransferase
MKTGLRHAAALRTGNVLDSLLIRGRASQFASSLNPDSRKSGQLPLSGGSCAGAICRSLLGAALDASRILLLLCADSVCRIFPARRQRVALIIRLDAVGDFFIWMQSGAAELCEYGRRLGLKNVLVANSSWAEFARTLNIWDAVLEVDTARFSRIGWYRFKCLRQIRAFGATVSIQPRAARSFQLDDEIVRVAGADRRIGSEATDLNTGRALRRLGDSFYTQLVPVNRDRREHETVRNCDFTRAIAGVVPKPYMFSQQDKAVRPGVIAVVPGAGWTGRNWPVANYAKLAAYILQTYPEMTIELLGSASDRHLGEEILLSVGRGIVDKIGKTTLIEYIDHLATAELVITNDSSAYHIAKALGRNVLCFLGGGHYGWFAPYPDDVASEGESIVLNAPMACYWCNWKCRFPTGPGGAVRCVASIPIDAAIRAFHILLPGSGTVTQAR